MGRIFYISGWMGKGPLSNTYKWLQRHYDNLAYVSAASFDADAKKAIDAVKAELQSDDLIVANSYGCFIASMFPNEQIWICPCLHPSISIARIAKLTDQERENFIHLEQQRDDSRSYIDRWKVNAIMAGADEVIRDYDADRYLLFPPVVIPEAHHQLSDEQREQYLKPVIDKVIGENMEIRKGKYLATVRKASEPNLDDKQWYQDHVTANEEELSRSFECGCVGCGEIFRPLEITGYIKDNKGRTAVCPYCMIDAVIGDASGMKMTKENLRKLNKKWF